MTPTKTKTKKQSEKEAKAVKAEAAYLLISYGWSNDEIATALDIKPSAIAAYRAHNTMRADR